MTAWLRRGIESLAELAPLGSGSTERSAEPARDSSQRSKRHIWRLWRLVMMMTKQSDAESRVELPPTIDSSTINMTVEAIN